MSVQETIFLNVLSAFIGALLTVTGRRIWALYYYRKGRKFWRPFAGRNSTFVIGRLDANLLLESTLGELDNFVVAEKRQPLFGRLVEILDQQENSGLIGVGDLEAVIYINSRLARARLPAILSVDRAERVTLDRIPHSIVVIGGGDMNDVARYIMREAGCQLDIGVIDNRNVVVDRANGDHVWAGQLDNEQDAPVSTEDGWYPAGMDFGILVRTERDGSLGTAALVLAGAQGLGTLAVAQACFDQEEVLLSYMKLYGPEIECLVKYQGWRRPGEKSVRVEVRFIFGRALVRPSGHR